MSIFFYIHKIKVSERTLPVPISLAEQDQKPALSIEFTANPQNAMGKTLENLPRAPLAPTREARPIPKSIRTRVNRLAHSRAQQHSQQVRDTAIARLQGMVDAFASIDGLCMAMAALEDARPNGCRKP